MASWKKVIVSGSIAELSAVSASAFYVQNGQVLTAPASTILSGSFSGSFAGNGANVTGVVTSSYALTASYALNVPTTASYALNALTASYSQTATSSSYAINASSAVSSSYALNATTAQTASYANNFTVAGTLTAQTIVVQTITSSVSEITGSSQFGSTTANTHQFTGSVSISGSLAVNGSNVITSNQTGSMSVNTASYAVNATTASYALNATTASYALNSTTASYAIRANSASYADKATQTLNALTLGTGLIGTSFNGSAAVTAAVSGAAALSTNLVPKWTGTGFANSNITDTGTQVQIGAGATSGLSVAAGGISVTGNSTFNNDLTVTGNLTVNGSATLINSTNTYLEDQFIQIASGSTTLTDAGIIAQYNAAGSGSAFFLDAGSAGSTGTYGRWAVAYDLLGTVTSATADEYLITTKISAANPSAAPTWGGATNGVGNMWVTTAGDIFIYA